MAVVFNENDRTIVATLKGNQDGLTIAEFNALAGTDLKPGSFTGAIKKGLIEVIGEREVERPSKKLITVYHFENANVAVKEDGSAYNYSDNEKAILDNAIHFSDGFSLADLSEKMGVKLTSGSINALVKKGNISKEAEKREVPCTKIAVVNVYGWTGKEPVTE